MKKQKIPNKKVIALAGNPNVGKSTVFNALTGMNQHTGNWPGKTVTNAQGEFKTKNANVILADIPGTYSLMAHSQEEEVARNFICFGGVDGRDVFASPQNRNPVGDRKHLMELMGDDNYRFPVLAHFAEDIEELP